MNSDMAKPAAEATSDQSQPSSIWIRGLYMLLFAIIARVTEAVVGIVMLIQFISKAATHQINENLLKFGHQLSHYLYAIVQFQTFNTEDKPFPFSPWHEYSGSPPNRTKSDG